MPSTPIIWYHILTALPRSDLGGGTAISCRCRLERLVHHDNRKGHPLQLSAERWVDFVASRAAGEGSGRRYGKAASGRFEYLELRVDGQGIAYERDGVVVEVTRDHGLICIQERVG